MRSSVLDELAEISATRATDTARRRCVRRMARQSERIGSGIGWVEPMTRGPRNGRTAVASHAGFRQTGSVGQENRLPVAIGLDVFFVVLFSALGRRTHDEGGAFVDVIETAAPFLIGLAIAWVLLRVWRRPTAVPIGLAVWPITLLVGMIVRRTVFDRGTATAFVVVATLFIGACLVGWRLALSAWERRQTVGTRSVRM